jgi:rSAM/selenodomain-associated transferase 2
VRLAIVIPTLDEAAALPPLLGDLRALSDVAHEIIVADGGSRDGTAALAAAAGARVVQASGGRARQLNAGARASRGEWLLLLHADSRLGADAHAAIRAVLTGIPSVQAAVFRFAIDLPPLWKRLIEAGQAARERWLGLPYGDQGLLVRRECFEAVGGYPELSLMEDVVMIRRLRRRFGVVRLPAAVVTSGRRYRQRGVVRTSLAHVMLMILFAVGVSPERLARWRNDAIALPR